MPNLDALSAICATFQIIGTISIFGWSELPRFTGALISVGGFACVVQAFLPGNQSPFFVIVAIAGVGLIIMGCIKAGYVKGSGRKGL